MRALRGGGRGYPKAYKSALGIGRFSQAKRTYIEHPRTRPSLWCKVAHSKGKSQDQKTEFANVNSKVRAWLTIVSRLCESSALIN